MISKSRLSNFNVWINGFFLCICIMCSPTLSAQNTQNSISIPQTNTILSSSLNSPPKINKLKLFWERHKTTVASNKWLLSALTVTLGIFGVHRLYLGTAPHIPVLYTVTLGGGLGIVPLVDLIFILATKDPNKFKNDERFFMWG